jgi:hypothetical protein
MAEQLLSDEDVSKPAPKLLSDEEVSAPAKSSVAPPPYPDDPASAVAFRQSGAAGITNAAQGNWFTRPFSASMEAIKNSFTDGGLSDSSIDDLTKAGALEDYKNTQAGWQHTVMGAITMPTAAIKAAALVPVDYAMRGFNALVTGGIALGGGFVNEATGAMGGGRENPEAVAREADSFANYLYISAGVSATGVPIKGVMPSLKEAMSLPAREEALPAAAAKEGEVVKSTAPIVTAPKENPMIDQESGNLNLKYIKTNDDVQGILARSAQAVADRDGVVISNSVTKEKGQALVDQALTESADGIPPELANRMRGDPTNEAQLYAARLLVKQAGEEVFNLGQIAQKTGDARDYAALEESYDRLMQINGIRHDISATIGRASQSHQIVIGGEEAATKIAGMSKEDAMRTAMTLPDEQAVAKMVDTMKKPGWSDMAIFHWVSWLLSNPVSHAAYAAAGELQKYIRYGESAVSVAIGGVQRAVGSGMGAEEFSALQKEREGIESRLAASDAGTLKIKASESGQMETRLKDIIVKQKAGESRMPEELAGRLFGIGKGYVDGIRATGRSLVTGGVQMFPGEEEAAQAAAKKASDAALEEGKSAEEATRAGNAAYSQAAVKMSNPIMERAEYIKNPLFKGLAQTYGRIVGLSPTMASAIHTFQKFAGFTESKYAIIYRRAALMGEADEATMGARIAKLMANTPDDILKQAAEDGKYASLVNRPGAFGQGLENFAHVNGWTRFVVPFARIATNLTSQTLLERTPIGIGLGPLTNTRVYQRLMGKEGAIAQSDAIGRMAVGSMITTAGASLAAQGIVNGIGPSKPNERAYNYQMGSPPLSVRIGNHALPLRLFGVPGRIISYGAAAYDVAQGFKEGDDAWDSFGHAIHTVADTALQENALKGLADFMDAVVGHDTEMSKRYALSMVGNIIVPRGIAQLTRLEDPYMRSTMGSGFMDRLQKTVDAQLPWKSSSLLPQVDVYGRDMLRNADHEKAMQDPVTQAEIAAHQYPTRVEPRISNVKLTDQQYYDYQKRAGTTYYDNMQRVINIPGFSDLPVETRADMIHSAMTQARAVARQYMIINDPKLAESIAKHTQELIEKRSQE